MNNQAIHAAVLRAHNKDLAFCDNVTNKICDILLKYLPAHKWIKYKHLVSQGTTFIYLTLTTLSNLLTLGEEYTGSILTQNGTLASRNRLFLMVIMKCFGASILSSIIKYFQTLLKDKKVKDKQTIKSHSLLIYLIDNFVSIKSFLEKFNITLFYLQGKYYNVSKRLTSLEYKALQKWMTALDEEDNFRLLGIVSLIQLTSSFTYNTINCQDFKEREEKVIIKLDQNQGMSESITCSLCLDDVCNATCTPCGHIFCWNCITTSLSSVKPECPMCRMVVQPNRIIPLQNL